jgi:hypothetical protein
MHRAGVIRAVAIAIVVGAGFTVRADEPAGCRIAWSCKLPEHPLSAGVVLGGLSDLAPVGLTGDDLALWTITDRGPNGTADVRGASVRTLVTPGFVPSLVRLRIERGGARDAAAHVDAVVPLRTPKQGPLSGRPRVADAENPIVHPESLEPVAADPHGVDPEAVAPMSDGTFWIAEEYGPSLLQVAADGTVCERHVPAGMESTEADVPERGTLPADYARRRDNRGFEGLAATADGTRLWAIVQSPLADEKPRRAKRAGNVRLLAFDPRAGRAVTEHVYRLGSPADPDYLTSGAAPDDGKLCAVTPLADGRLLVIEQDDDGLAHLYVVTPVGATDTLRWRPPAGCDAATLEQVVDLPGAGIVPVEKTLVADLTDLRAAMAAEADGGTARHGLLKLEGLAVLGPRHVAIVNDNDFGVQGGPPTRGSRLWVLELARPLTGR